MAGPQQSLSIIRVDSRAFPTRSGARVGDSLSQLRQLYGSKLERGETVGDTELETITDGDHYLQFILTGERVTTIVAGTGIPDNLGFGSC